MKSDLERLHADSVSETSLDYYVRRDLKCCQEGRIEVEGRSRRFN